VTDNYAVNKPEIFLTYPGCDRTCSTTVTEYTLVRSAASK